ncbi:MAG TPA: hypothetical protein VF707_09670, partial [Ardenticatenaceae bacterium]|jgi:hypothetical protein
VAQIGDWIVGTGSKNSPIGDVSGRVVYAMKVTRKMRMEEYDDFTVSNLPMKIPDWRNKDVRRRLGDSIYDFSVYPPKLRRSVHIEANRARDLGGTFALLSDYFYYFGDDPALLPLELLPVVKQGQGHRSGANAVYVQGFVEWINGLGYEPNILHGQPQLQLFKNEFRSKDCEIGPNGLGLGLTCVNVSNAAVSYTPEIQRKKKAQECS